MSIIDQIIQVESAGNPNAKNPRSSATGPGQFIDSTWLSTIAKYRPDLTTGRTREEILSLRSDPAISRQMTEAYAAENAAGLTKAGFQATPGNTYLAHFAGPQGALNVLSADPATPVANILDPRALKANQFLSGMTAADLVALANNKMNTGPSSPSVAATQTANIPIAAQPDQSTPNSAQAPVQDATLNNPQMMMRYLAQFDQQPQMPPTLGIPEPPMQRAVNRQGPFRGAFSFGRR